MSIADKINSWFRKRGIKVTFAPAISLLGIFEFQFGKVTFGDDDVDRKVTRPALLLLGQLIEAGIVDMHQIKVAGDVLMRGLEASSVDLSYSTIEGSVDLSHARIGVPSPADTAKTIEGFLQSEIGISTKEFQELLNEEINIEP